MNSFIPRRFSYSDTRSFSLKQPLSFLFPLLRPSILIEKLLDLIRTAEGGHLQVLKYLYSRDVPRSEETFLKALLGGHMEVLKYLTVAEALNKLGILLDCLRDLFLFGEVEIQL